MKQCQNCETELKHRSSETIDGRKVWSDDYSKPWTMENSLYCPKCNPESLEDFIK